MFVLDLVNNLGVGFYSAYLVAHKVIVTSKYNDLDQYIWESQLDGSLIFTKDINAQKIPRGTNFTLFLKDDQVSELTHPHFFLLFPYFNSFFSSLVGVLRRDDHQESR